MESTLIRVSEYVAFDLETTGLSPANDEILEIGAVAVRDGEVVGEFQTFAKPERHDEWAVAESITGITPSMTANAPGQKDAVAAFIEFAAGRCLVGHNAAGFDARFLKSVLGEDPPCPLVDTLRISKMVEPDVKHGLESMCALAVKEGAESLCEAGRAHRAVYDSYMVATLYEFLKPRMKETSSVRRHGGGRKGPSAETLAVSDVLGKLEMVAAGKALDEALAKSLLDDISVCEPGKKTGMFDDVESSLESFIEGDADETAVMERVAALFDPVVRTVGVVDVVIDGKSFVLTGDFEIGDRKNVVAPLIVSNGGIVKSGVSSRTDFVVVGDLGSDAWAFGNYGTKVTKALDLKAAGKDIKIIGEKVLADALNLSSKECEPQVDALDLDPSGPSDQEKKFRKRLGLPVKKAIVYYDRDENAHEVTRISIAAEGEMTGLFSLDVTTKNGSTHRICSEYLSDMQKHGYRKEQ